MGNIKLVIDKKDPSKPLVKIYEDQSTPSCGENRCDWVHLDSVSLISLLKSVESLATGKTERQYL